MIKNQVKPKQKFHLVTFGCQMNYSDSERLSAVLEQAGYTATNDESEADLIGVVSCSVRQKAIDRTYGKLNKWQKMKKKKPLITLLSGCLTDKDRQALKDKFDLFVDIKKLDNLAKDLSKLNTKLSLPKFFDIKPKYYSSYRAYVPIMTGCNKFCTYCVVPYTRGREISRPANQIIKEVKELLAQGYREIILLGQNVNSYGLDQKNNLKFPELLQKIDKLAGNFWLKFLTSHPDDMSDDLIKVIAQSKHINDYIHLPVQSGSNAILKKMNRHYTITAYKKLIKKIRKNNPEITISTDIIVGFCGETNKQFLDTKKLVQELKFNLAYTSQYSDRSGTVASKTYQDNVDKKTKKQKWEIINKIISTNSLEFNKKLVGQQRPVLIDVVKKTKDGYNNIGKLSNYTTVHILTKKPLTVGKFTTIKIIEAKSWGIKAKII